MLENVRAIIYNEGELVIPEEILLLALEKILKTEAIGGNIQVVRSQIR